MQGAETIYFLFDEKNSCLKVINGMVINNSHDLTPLQFAPSGWQDISIQNNRNAKYFAMDRSFTVPLDFVEDGAQILKDRYYKKGIEEKVYLVIMKQQLYFDDTYYGYYYTLLYKGEIDFSQLKHTGEKVTANIMEGGAAKYVKANEGIKYPISINTPEAIKIKMDGISLYGKQNFAFIDGFVMEATLYRDFIVPLVLLTEEGKSVGITFFSSEYDSVDSLGGNFGHFFHYMKESPNYFQIADATNADTVDTIIVGKFGIKLTKKRSIAPFRVQIVKVPKDYDDSNLSPVPPNVLSFYILFTNGGLTNTGDTEVVDINLTIPLSPGDRLFMNVNMNSASNADPSDWEFLPDSRFSVSYINKNKTTFIKAHRPKYVYEQTVNKISDGTVEAESVALETYKTLAITCGDALRGFADAEIKTSLSDFFQSLNTILSIGMGSVNGKLKLERKPDWIDNVNTINLGEGKELSVSSATDFLFNSLKIGFPSQDYEDINGRQEFNNTHIYSAPVTRVNKELDLTSIYRADCYGAEFTRINFDGKTTTDSSSDNDVFVLHIKETPIIDPVEGEVYELDRTLNQYATGLLTPESVFNLFLSPKQCLLRNGQYLRSCFYKQDTGVLKFQTTEKNSALSVAAPPGTITESADIEIAKLGERLFVPVLLEFETRVPVNLLELLNVNPLTSFETSYLTAPLKGIPNKTGIKPEDQDSQTYQLLASPDTNLENLIDVYE